MASYADIKNGQQEQAAQGAAQQAQAAEMMNFQEFLANSMKPNEALNAAKAQSMAKQYNMDQMRNGNAGQMAFADGARVGQMANAQGLQNEALAMEMAADQNPYGNIDPAMASMAANDANSSMVAQGMPAVDNGVMDSAAMYRQAAGGPGVVEAEAQRMAEQEMYDNRYDDVY